MTSLNFSEYNVDAPEVVGFEKPRFNKPPKNQTIKKKRNVSNLLKTMNTRPSLDIAEQEQEPEPEVDDEEETDWNAAYSGKMELPSPPEMPKTQESFAPSDDQQQQQQYTRQYVPYYATQAYEPAAKDQVMDKMNYMIHLLEEQKDEKSGGVIEELILYGFLGVFMIFMVDSFAKVGRKYTR
jgi:hypothetical protein